MAKPCFIEGCIGLAVPGSIFCAVHRKPQPPPSPPPPSVVLVTLPLPFEG